MSQRFGTQHHFDSHASESQKVQVEFSSSVLVPACCGGQRQGQFQKSWVDSQNWFAIDSKAVVDSGFTDAQKLKVLNPAGFGCIISTATFTAEVEMHTFLSLGNAS